MKNEYICKNWNKLYKRIITLYKMCLDITKKKEEGYLNTYICAWAFLLDLSCACSLSHGSRNLDSLFGRKYYLNSLWQLPILWLDPLHSVLLWDFQLTPLDMFDKSWDRGLVAKGCCVCLYIYIYIYTRIDCNNDVKLESIHL